MCSSYETGFALFTQIPCVDRLGSSLPPCLSLELRSPSFRIWILIAPLLLCHLEFRVMTYLSVASKAKDGHWVGRFLDSPLTLCPSSWLESLSEPELDSLMIDQDPVLALLEGATFSISTYLWSHSVHRCSVKTHYFDNYV